MRRMYDAAYPPASPPAWDAVAAYIGGDTPHVWTAAEWDAQPARYRLPIYVRSDPSSASATGDAGAAIGRLRILGAPRGCAVALDLETAVDDAYVRGFDATLTGAGYLTVAYGSVSTIFSNPRPSGGYWVAHYTGEAHMEPGAVITQWADDQMLGTDYDANQVDDSVPLWDTHGPAPIPPLQEDDMPLGALKTGPKAATTISFPKGKYTVIGFLADNGYVSKPAVQLRVAVHSAGSGWSVSNITVDSAKGKETVHFPHADTDGFSVDRIDAGDVEVGWDIS